ncbi:MAG: hypothetical protein KJO16_01875, partial [Muriicola sp.]|nr:hypothetical protein [Muriicola sp.]
GLAIPDSVCEEHYFYMSGYVNNKSLDPESLTPLKHGNWISKGFKGAILPFRLSAEGRVDAFLKDAFSALKAEFKNAK